MPTLSLYNTAGINTYINPLLKKESELIRAINVDSFPYGAKSKRPGYVTYLGAPDASQVNTLFSWTKNDGTTLFTYRASGSALYYSIQGTGAWTLAGNGTITNGGHVGHAVLGDTLIIGDGVGSTRHTTNGTSFTNTTLAPIGEFFEQYQNRIFIGGTASTLFYSTTGDATNWATSGTSDSSSITIPDAGKINGVFKTADRLTVTKNSGLIFKWDGFQLIDASTTLGPSSPYSVDKSEGYYFWCNRLGHYGYGGAKPQLLSNAIQNEFYNTLGSGVPGTTFPVIPGGVHRYDYYATLGDVTDEFTMHTISNAIMKYDFQKNEYLHYQFFNKPTAYHSYKDNNGNQQLIFGDGSGQCYTFGGTVTSDNGNPSVSTMEFLITPQTNQEKDWRWLELFFNPGCEASIDIATSDTFYRQEKQWRPIGQAIKGFVGYRFPSGSRSRLLYLRISDYGSNARWYFYGGAITYNLNDVP